MFVCLDCCYMLHPGHLASDGPTTSWSELPCLISCFLLDPTSLTRNRWTRIPSLLICPPPPPPSQRLSAQSAHQPCLHGVRPQCFPTDRQVCAGVLPITQHHINLSLQHTPTHTTVCSSINPFTNCHACPNELLCQYKVIWNTITLKKEHRKPAEFIRNPFIYKNRRNKIPNFVKYIYWDSSSTKCLKKRKRKKKASHPNSFNNSFWSGSSELLYPSVVVQRGGGKCCLRVSPVVEVAASASLSALPPRCTMHRQLSQHPHIMHV